MAENILINAVGDLIRVNLEGQGLELVDFICRIQGQKLILTVLADKPSGGISLSECAQVCRQLNNLLEEKKLMERDYTLEVASPGLDRALKSEKDFLRVLNKEVIFFLKDLVSGKCQWQGVVRQVQAQVVFIQVGQQSLEIPISKISKAQLVI